ncbi:MAG: histidine kinase, partial [Chloroflexota bacterium]|nr:histidine kinase [Chloroflexota bacterium]
MKTTAYEPGLIPIFRLFIGVMFVLLTLGLGSYLRRVPPDLYGILMWGFCGTMSIYLGWQAVQRSLGARWLPLALWAASLFPILADASTNYFLVRQGVTDPELLVTTRLYLWLLIPLLLVSAQYGLRSLLLFSVGTALLPSLLALPLAERLDYAGYLTEGGVRLALYTLTGYIVMRITSASRQQREALGLKNRQLANYAATLEQLAVARERNRLARELHDTLAHTLSAVNVQLKALDVMLETDPEAARRALQETQALTRTGLQEARRSLQALRARPIDELGLGLALSELARRAAERAGLALTLAVPSQVEG